MERWARDTLECLALVKALGALPMSWYTPCHFLTPLQEARLEVPIFHYPSKMIADPFRSS